MTRQARIAPVAGLCLTIVAAIIPYALYAQITAERLVRANDEPHNWLTYSGSYSSHRHSALRQIDPSNVKNLELKWIHQMGVVQSVSTTPIVVDGVMYVTRPPNDVLAMDGRTGQVFWQYSYTPKPGTLCCRGPVNRGLAILGDTLYMATLDAQLIAIDRKNGKPVWKTQVADAKESYSLTLAPLVVKDMVIVGPSGGDLGFGDSSTPMMPRQASGPGASTRFLALASRATRRGVATPGCTAGRRRGTRARTTRSSI